jgi:hypothetical protein
MAAVEEYAAKLEGHASKSADYSLTHNPQRSGEAVAAQQSLAGAATRNTQPKRPVDFLPDPRSLHPLTPLHPLAPLRHSTTP